MKRALDFAISVAALMVLSPIIAIVAIVVRCTMGRPILFRQIRPGLHADLFEMVKFRTMLDDRDTSGELLDDDVRTHPVGNFLRSTSLDELPTLLNVVRGDMSLVGPRPLMPEYVERYNTEQARRHEVKPGITGLAQVRGRNTTSWEQRFADDVEYVDSHSVLGDVGIMIATVRTLVAGGADALGEDAPGEFWGSEPQTHHFLD